MNICKHITAILITIALLGVFSCQRGKPIDGEQKLDFTPGWSMRQGNDLKVSDDIEPLGPPCPEYVHVHREWKDLPNSVFPFEVPSDRMVEKWKRQFEEANDADSVWFNDYLNCRGIDRWLTINDLIEFSFGPRPASDEDDLRTIWRLLQYDSGYKGTPVNKVEKVLHIEEAIDTLLNYYAGSQLDMNLRACLENELHEFYCRMMLRAISEHVSFDLRSALQREEQAWERYYEQVSKDYEYLFDSPDDIPGSAWPMYFASYLEMHLQLRWISLEGFMLAVLDGAPKEEIPSGNTITTSMITNEYKQFAASIDDEYGYPIETQRNALVRDRKSWENWQACRAAVSAQLPAKEKVVYDRCTKVVRRYKYIMLKNRYMDHGLLSNDMLECIIPYSASDEELSGPSYDEKWKASWDQ